MLYFIIGLMLVISWVLFKRLMLVVGLFAVACTMSFFVMDGQDGSNTGFAQKFNKLKNIVDSESQIVYSFYSTATNTEGSVVDKLVALSREGGKLPKNNRLLQSVNKIKEKFDIKNNQVYREIKNKVRSDIQKINNLCSDADKVVKKSQNNVQDFIRKVEDFNIKNKALFYAISKDQVKIAEGLIKSGADVNARDQYGRTPLIIASTCCQSKMAEMLLRNKAARNRRDNDNHTALMRAALMKDMTTFKVLITDDTDHASMKNKGDTLLIATRLKCTEMVKLLLKNRANLEVKDDKGRTALIIAASKGYKEIVQALMANNINVDAKGNDGCTALIAAEKKNHTEVVELLKTAKK